ncbi:MAG TPA: hypothetical protein VET23_00685 [Chitinophagaceae bacterium]|nr:hypothetical protein [Chitinophagaceae bacterium]
MKEFISFFKENIWLVLLIVAIACIILGRIWSNNLNWGDITDPKLIMKKGKNYKVINLYLGKGWTEDWVAGSIICFKFYHHRFFVKYSKEIYVSGDKIRFDDDGPVVGKVYKAVFPKSLYGLIVMKPAS